MEMENKGKKPSLSELMDSIGAIGEITYAIYQGMVKAGFTREEAMEMTKCVTKGLMEAVF